jgi:FixJ family two-component response regulator
VSLPAKPLVAVVDDEYRVLEALEDLLESAGYEVRRFGSAEQFLNTAAVAEVDYVITDIGMPSTNGFSFQEMVRRARPTLPVILITGRHEFTAGTFEAERGGRLLMEKPLDTRKLLAAIGSALRASSASSVGQT